jgi:hypothetical protein
VASLFAVSVGIYIAVWAFTACLKRRGGKKIAGPGVVEDVEDVEDVEEVGENTGAGKEFRA